MYEVRIITAIEEVIGWEMDGAFNCVHSMATRFQE